MRNLRNLNLNALTAIESVHRLGSFTRAAEEINVTPSAISQRISTFEKQLGFSLFDRRATPLATTPEGTEFIMHCRDALDTILAAGMLHEHEDRDVVLKISVLPTFAVRWLMPRLKSFDASNPGIRLHISQSYESVNFSQVDIDIAVRYGDGRFPGLDATMLMCEDLVPALSPALLKQQLPGLRPEDMHPEDLKHFTLMHSGTCHLYWRSWLHFAGVPDVLKTAKAMSFDSCVLTLQAANMGIGVALANRVYIADDVEAGSIITPFESKASRRNGWYLVYPPGLAREPKVQMFKNWIIEEARQASEQMKQQAARTVQG